MTTLDPSRHAPMRPPSEGLKARALVGVARAAIAAALAGVDYRPPRLGAPFDAPGNVFVTLRSPDGALRGCVGRTRPVLATIVEEIADCAVAAATRDHRMPSVRPEELEHLAIELSLLAPPEPIADASELDPQRYGVIVSDGVRQGVLLPAVPGVDTAAEQVAIAARKGGIEMSPSVRLSRFEVVKVSERD